MFYFVGHQPHCHIEDDHDGLQTAHLSLDKMLGCSDHHAALPSSSSATSSRLTGKSTEQTSQLLISVIKENTSKFAHDHVLYREYMGAWRYGIYLRVFTLILNE